MGSPPPNPLATAITSGTIPACWCAHHFPVRPIPLWISSSMSRRLRSSQSRRRPRRVSSLIGTTPDWPSIGSMSTATVLSSIALSTAARSS